MGESELADVTEIDQTDNTEQLNAVDAVSDADSGTVGPNSDVDYVEDEGSSLMTWILIGAGVVLVLALCAGAAMMMKNKNQGSYNEQHNTQMTESNIDLP